jgi:hypothetical protein
MLARLAADAVLLVHLAFIAFVMLGALLVVRRRSLAFVHVPAALWGAFAESTGRPCPLTAVENALRASAGLAGYGESFVEHYLLGVIYPDGLTRGVQLALAGLVIAVNVALYIRVFHRPTRVARPNPEDT